MSTTTDKDGQHKGLKYLKFQLQYLLYKCFKQHFGGDYLMHFDAYDNKHHAMFSNGFSIDNQRAYEAIKFVQDLFNEVKNHGFLI